jgi:hypothetical protein
LTIRGQYGYSTHFGFLLSSRACHGSIALGGDIELPENAKLLLETPRDIDELASNA